MYSMLFTLIVVIIFFLSPYVSHIGNGQSVDRPLLLIRINLWLGCFIVITSQHILAITYF
nr:MAG TPA: hypothetical protein [Caudoviricetes sp.]